LLWASPEPVFKTWAIKHECTSFELNNPILSNQNIVLIGYGILILSNQNIVLIGYDILILSNQDIVLIGHGILILNGCTMDVYLN
jgi:hypothetical protein